MTIGDRYGNMIETVSRVRLQGPRALEVVMDELANIREQVCKDLDELPTKLAILGNAQIALDDVTADNRKLWYYLHVSLEVLTSYQRYCEHLKKLIGGN